MAEAADNELQGNGPQTKYLKHYKISDFTIDQVELNFDLHDEITHVKSLLKIRRQGSAEAPLILDGKDMKLVSVQIDGKIIDYIKSDENLTIENVPDNFELTIINNIDPAGYLLRHDP